MNESILFCTGIFPPDIGGPSSYVFKMASQMSNDGFNVAVLTYSDKKQIDNYNFKVFRIKRIFFVFNYIKFFLYLIKKGGQFDIIYLQGSFSDGIPTILANFFLRKYLVIRIGGIFAWEFCKNNNFTNDLPEEFYSKKQNIICEIFKCIDKFVISKCNKILANSNYTKKLLLLNKIGSEKIKIVYNPHESLNYSKAQGYELLKKFNLPNKKIILSYGRFVPWKNFDKLIYFSRKLSSNYLLLLIGDGPEKNKLQNIVKKEKLENKVIILDKQPKDNLLKLNSIAHIFVLLSSYEGSSNALIEAMQQKLPIIASNIEPNIETLKGYKNCKLIKMSEDIFINSINQLDFLDSPDTQENNELTRFDFRNIYKKTIKELCL